MVARQTSATSTVGRASFLLEMALDQARLRERFASVLLRERTKRGGGDPQRFPQPAMAQVLGVSSRQYQRYESAASLPRWNALEEIAGTLGIEIGDLIGEAEPSNGDLPVEGELAAAVATLIREAARLGDSAERLDEWLRQQAEEAHRREPPAQESGP